MTTKKAERILLVTRNGRDASAINRALGPSSGSWAVPMFGATMGRAFDEYILLEGATLDEAIEWRTDIAMYRDWINTSVRTRIRVATDPV